QRPTSAAPEKLVLVQRWNHEPQPKATADREIPRARKNGLNVTVGSTAGGLGGGRKWAVVKPKELIPRYKPGWPTQQEWVNWTHSFDWLSIAVGFIRTMLDSL